MHAAFPRFTKEVHQIMQLGLRNGAQIARSSKVLDEVKGKLLAEGMAALLKFGFGFVLREGLVGGHKDKALAFFNENFLFTDPESPGGIRYYQGKFLIRTREPGDDMNVWLRFCPQPEKLFLDKAHTFVNHEAVVTATVLNEDAADLLETQSDKVDLVIRFKDVQSITGLLGRSNMDMTGLLLENLVQMSGNVGHLFKLGAIAKNVELSLNLPRFID